MRRVNTTETRGADTPRPAWSELLASEAGRAWLGRRLALAAILLAVGFVGYYSYDRYFVQVESQMDLTVKRLEDGVRENPNDPQARVMVANAYARQKDFDRAMAQYEQALVLRPEWSPAMMAMASTELLRGNEARSEEIYLKVAELNKDNEFRYANRDLQLVYLRLGSFASKAERHAEAAHWAAEALKVSRSDADAHFLLGRSEEAQGHLAEAAEAYRLASAFDPNFREAFSALQRVASARGDSREASYAQGMGLLAAGDLDTALMQFQQLVKQAPDYPEAYQGLGLAYGKKGQREEAQQAFRAALDRNPELLLAQWSLRSVEGR